MTLMLFGNYDIHQLDGK